MFNLKKNLSYLCFLWIPFYLFMSLHFMKLDGFLKFLISFKPSYLRGRSWTHVCGQNLPFDGPVPGFCCRTSPSLYGLFYSLVCMYRFILKKKNLIFQWGWVLKNAFVSLTMSNWKWKVNQFSQMYKPFPFPFWCLPLMCVCLCVCVCVCVCVWCLDVHLFHFILFLLDYQFIMKEYNWQLRR